MKTNLDKFFKVDDVLAKDGVDFVLQEKNEKENIPEVSLRVRHFNEQNPRIKAAMATYYKPHARQIEMGTLSQEKSAEINHKVFIDTCLVSWTGILDDKGNAIECNKENALALFKRLPALFDAIWKHSNDFQSYKEDVGNS